MKSIFVLVGLSLSLFANDLSCCKGEVLPSCVPCEESLPVVSSDATESACQKNDNQKLNEAMEVLKRGDFTTALGLFKQLADEGNFIAQQNLGVMYNNGYGVAKNSKIAAYWFNKAQESIESKSKKVHYIQSASQNDFMFEKVCLK